MRRVYLSFLGIEHQLRGFVEKLAKYRNGFDHAWIAQGGAYRDIDQVGADCLNELRAVTEALVEQELLV